jgi:hypothetical protein
MTNFEQRCPFGRRERTMTKVWESTDPRNITGFLLGED